MENCKNTGCLAYNKSLKYNCCLHHYKNFAIWKCREEYLIHHNPAHAKQTIENLETLVNWQRKQKTRLRIYILILFLTIVSMFLWSAM